MAERRARKAERRAENIRKAYPGDASAERRAQKAERRAENIRNHAWEQERENSWEPRYEKQGSSDTWESDSNDKSAANSGSESVIGCLVMAVVAIAILSWIWEKVSSSGPFKFVTGLDAWVWILVVVAVIWLFGKSNKGGS